MAKTPEEQLDQAHWEAVEEVAELVQQEQHQQALYLVRDVVKSDPRNPYAYFLMGVSLAELAQLEAARDAFRAAVHLEPRYVGARGSLAQVLRRLHEPRAAVREGKAALQLKPDDPDALQAVGMAYADLGQRPEARRHLEAFLRTKPEIGPAQEARQVLARLAEPGEG